MKLSEKPEPYRSGNEKKRKQRRRESGKRSAGDWQRSHGEREKRLSGWRRKQDGNA